MHFWHYQHYFFSKRRINLLVSEKYFLLLHLEHNKEFRGTFLKGIGQIKMIAIIDDSVTGEITSIQCYGDHVLTV